MLRSQGYRFARARGFSAFAQQYNAAFRPNSPGISQLIRGLGEPTSSLTIGMRPAHTCVGVRSILQAMEEEPTGLLGALSDPDEVEQFSRGVNPCLFTSSLETWGMLGATSITTRLGV